MSLLKDLSDQGKLVVFVTHNPSLAARAQRVIKVQDGNIVSDEYC